MFINRWQIAIILYILIIALLVYLKPALMFTADGNIKIWGSQNTNTTSVFSPMIMFPLLGFLCYYLGIWLELVFN